MKKDSKKDKYACFQWIRNIRDEMSRDMADMTIEERMAYLQKRHEKAQKGRPSPSSRAKGNRSSTLNSFAAVIEKYSSKKSSPQSKNT